MAFKSRGVVGKLQREEDFQVPGCFMLTLRGSLPRFMDLSTGLITVGQVLYKGRKGKSPMQDIVFLDMVVTTHTLVSPTLGSVGNFQKRSPRLVAGGMRTLCVLSLPLCAFGAIGGTLPRILLLERERQSHPPRQREDSVSVLPFRLREHILPA